LGTVTVLRNVNRSMQQDSMGGLFASVCVFKTTNGVSMLCNCFYIPWMDICANQKSILNVCWGFFVEATICVGRFVIILQGNSIGGELVSID
jgi:hypothetical protein